MGSFGRDRRQSTPKPREGRAEEPPSRPARSPRHKPWTAVLSRTMYRRDMLNLGLVLGAASFGAAGCVENPPPPANAPPSGPKGPAAPAGAGGKIVYFARFG